LTEGPKPLPAPSYFDAMDYPGLIAAFGRPEDFAIRIARISRDELRALQEGRFARVMAFAWKVPFYRRLWAAKGLTPGDIRGLDDITRLPAYSKSDLMTSVEAYPPLGDFHGLDTYAPEDRPPLIFQTTSGTTGRPQPLLFGPKSREVQNLLLARLYALQGLRRDDVVHSVYGHGMVNGGHYVREAVTHWTGAQFLSAGTGVETRSAQQVALMRDFGATAIVGFGDYIKRLSEVAREEGIVPGDHIRIRMISGHMGAESHAAMSQAWGGAEVFDWYGVGDTGAIAGEGPDHAGMYVQEDAQFLELLDIETGLPAADGQPGDMVVTCLYKDDIFPIIRFNTHDVSAFVPGTSDLGLTFRRITGFLGRSDNMVKLRGINIYPTGVGAILTASYPELSSEYICRVDRRAGRDEMTVLVETRGALGAPVAGYEALLRTRLGVEVTVELALPGALSALTQIEVRQKPIRLIDTRKDKG
jgi:phenylacetate-CoA ligase